jgi:dTDP-4-dehydrorhamnose 3,5-epimerase
LPNFNFIKTELPGAFIIEPKVFGDARGFFMEIYQKEAFENAGIACNFVQDNHSKSKKGVLRGLHFQTQNTQAKLVRVISGVVYDVAVDLRPNSPAFGKWAGVELSCENKRQFFIPEGFAHGFLVTSDEAEFCYKCSDYYNPKADGGIIFNDETIAVKWPKLDIVYSLSEKDAALQSFKAQNFALFEGWYKP